MNGRKDFTIIRGLPGRGKSTLAAKLAPNFNYTADDYPGLYDDAGVYNRELQSQAHAWCLNQVESAMVMGFSPIAVHNNFASVHNVQRYLKMAVINGYTSTVIHSEAVFFSTGVHSESIHNVPEAIIEGMANTWEPLNPGYPLLTPQEIEFNLNSINVPSVIFAEVDRTIKDTKSGSRFPRSPKDFVITEDFLNGWRRLTNDFAYPVDLFIVSNQREVGSSGRFKTKEFLIEEMTYLIKALSEKKIPVTGAAFALKKNSPECLLYFQKDWTDILLTSRADKPGTGMIRFFVDHVIRPESLSELNTWVVGNAHNALNNSDLAMARLLVDDFPFLRYIPTELFKIACELALAC